MLGIYKITNPKGKIYIGQSINIDERIKHYKNNSGKRQPKIYNSIQKYGWDNHMFEIIEECSLEQLNEKEIYWKKYYLEQLENNWSNVLFCELYDSGGGPLSEETRKKMSYSKLGTKLSIKTKEKIRNSKLGTKHSKETKERMSEMRIGKTTSKTVLQFDIKGNFIKEWSSGRQASLKLNICYSHINKILNGGGKTAGGYIWKFKNN
jgi:group I intron endonuclease